MRRFTMPLTPLALIGALLFASNTAAAGYWEKQADKKAKAAQSSSQKKDKDTEKPFAEVIKNFDKVPGLFDFYINKKDSQVFMAIKPGQLNKTLLCNLTLSAADGNFFDAASMMGSFPFQLRQVGKRIQFVQINLRLRADTTAAISRAKERSISNAIFGSTSVASLPDTNAAFLIDPSAIMVTDVGNVGYFVGSEGKTGYRFDKDNSNFGTIKSFPQNSEIDVVLHYKTDKPSSGAAVAYPYSMLLTFHYSLSTLPETDYRPRLADDRVGYFTTIFQDYTKLDNEETYVRYINRWNLEKKDPTAALSEPKEPIVFWIENTTPVEYRDALCEGVLFWNSAFEKAGFKDAVVCKQMPDTADWDPADVRFNTIRWFTSPGAGYAAGPSRANPFTGQIYDADIRVSADFIRYMFEYADKFIEPLSMGDPEKKWLVNDQPGNPDGSRFNWEMSENCGALLSQSAAEGIALLNAYDPFAGKPELTKKYVHQYIVELISHEVGHTLGLRHNFKSSAIYTLAQLGDSAFTGKNGLTGSIMDYTPANLALENIDKLDFYMNIPGPYDNWAIEYGYRPIDARDTQGEKEKLNEIASRSSETLLAYGTDEDCFGNGPRAIDPYTTQFDFSSDPLEYWQMRVALSKKFWSKFEAEFEKPGQNYKRLRAAFAFGWSGFSSGGLNVSRFIGGIRHNRDHVGNSAGRLPFEPISAEKQREAMKFLVDNVWSADAFQFSPQMLNKLQPERMDDFNGTVWQMPRIDYPFHEIVLRVQTGPLNQIYAPTTLARLGDIEVHYGKDQKFYTMTDVFQDVRKAIWSEVSAGKNISSIRRNLQRTHLSILVDLVTDTKLPVPKDAVTLARVDLRSLKSAISADLGSGNLNTITRGHLEDSLARVTAALDASINLKM